jgi:pimeloyl-ACP methyl ester carboxylesterase
VILLGGVGESGDSWPPLVAALADSNMVVVPDLRGSGRSSHPPDGYDKRTQALDVRSVIGELGFDRSSIVGHGVGGQVAYAYASLFPGAVARLVVMESRLAGIAPWEAIVDVEQYEHFAYFGPDTAHKTNVNSDLREQFRAAMKSDPDDRDGATEAFFAAKDTRAGLDRPITTVPVAAALDIRDNLVFAQTKLAMPVLALGGAQSVGALQATIMRQVATDVREVIVAGAGHWVLEQRPDGTVETIVEFLREPLDF